MSNYDLEREISRVESQISSLNSEIRRLEDELGALYNSVSSANSSLVNTSSELNSSMEYNKKSIQYSHSQLRKTFNTQLQLKEMYYIFKDVETANKKIRMLTNKLYFDYKNQSVVRKIVRGFLDNLDLQMVSDSTIYKALEKEFIQAPNYWLAYSLLSVMFWKNDNKDKAYQALEEAIKLNKKSTSVFFMLFYLKIGRIETALLWFKEYQEIEKTGFDNSTFLMLLSSITKPLKDLDESDDMTKAIVEYLQKQIESDKEEVDQNKLVGLIYAYFVKLDHREALSYPTIRQYVQENQTLANGLSMAKNNSAILEFVENVHKVHLNERNLYLNKFLDELISIPSEEEQVIINEIKLNEEILSTMEFIKNAPEEQVYTSSDFKKIAKENHQKRVEHDTGKLNLVSEMVDWVYLHKNSDVNSITYYNLFSLTKNYTTAAYGRYLNNYRSLFKNTCNVKIADYSFTTDFTSLDKEINNKNAFCKRKEANLLKKVKKGGTIASLVIGIMLIIAGLVLSFLYPDYKIYCYVGAGLGALLVLIAIINLTIVIPKKKGKIKQNIKKEKSRLEEIIKKLFTEMADLKMEFAENDKISNYIRDYINKA